MGRGVYAGQDVFMIRQVSFAVFASVDTVRVEVNVVRETHFEFLV